MQNWKKYKLDDIATKIGDGLHGTPIYNESGEYMFVNGSNLVDGKVVVTSNTKWVDYSQYSKYKKELSNRTILLGINGTIGNVAIYNNEKCILGKSACYINVDENFDKNFIKYVLLNEDFQNYIRSNATGSVIKNVGLKLLRDFEVPIPSDIETQQRIASILSSLDDKIELNRCMNQTLEQIAATLFKKYFVDDIDSDNLPEGWRWGKLGEIVEVKGGTTPSTANREFWEGEYHWTSPRDLSNLKFPVLLNTEKKITKAGLKKVSSGLLPKGTLLLSSRAPIGYLAITEIPVAINQGYIAIIDNKGYSNYFMLYWLKENMDVIIRNANGSTFLEVSKSVFRNIDLAIPPMPLVNSFDENVKNIFFKLVSNEKENILLTKLRDTLLPKLMSGELDVTAINQNEPLNEEVLI